MYTHKIHLSQTLLDSSLTSPITSNHNQHPRDAADMQLVLNKIDVNQSSILVNCLLLLRMLREWSFQIAPLNSSVGQVFFT